MEVVLVAPMEIRAVQVFHDFSDEALQFRGKPGPGSEGVILELEWVWAWEANRIPRWEPSWHSFKVCYSRGGEGCGWGTVLTDYLKVASLETS